MKTNNNEMQIKVKKDKIIVIVGDTEYELHYSFRIYIMYETITDKNVDYANLKLSDLFVLFYSTVLATLQYNKIEHALKYDEFMNIVDDNGGEVILTSFTTWFVNKMQQQAELLQTNNDEEKEDKKKSLKKTKKGTTKNN